MKLQRAAYAVVLTAAAALVTGCETKGFLDPTEVGRFEKTPLVVPILDKLVVGVEGDDVEFAGAREVRAEDLSANAKDYLVGPNDVLTVTIQDLAGAGTVSTEQKKVSESGKISLPYLSQVPVNGMTESDIEVAIAKAYADANILPKAIVSVSVTDSQNRIYNVSGAITQPGTYPLLRGDLRLLDAIATARGPTSELGIDYIYVIRRKPAGSGSGTTEPAVTPGKPGVDPLAPTSRGPASPVPRPVFMMARQPADPMSPATTPAATPAAMPAAMPAAPMPASPTTPDDARAAAEKLARELQDARTAAASQPTGTTPAMPTDNTRDRVIQIEGAGTQPAMSGDPGMTVLPPMPSGPMPTATAAPFEFTAPAEPTDLDVIKVPYPQLKRGELKYNIVIQPQDMIILPSPPIGEYYMYSHAARPGVYSLSARKITLTQAVISAGGLDQLAIPSRTDIVRRVSANQNMIVRVDLDRIFSGLEPNIYLKPDDEVRIGTNAIAPFAAALRNGFRITYGFGFLYDRNYAPQQNNNN